MHYLYRYEVVKANRDDDLHQVFEDSASGALWAGINGVASDGVREQLFQGGNGATALRIDAKAVLSLWDATTYVQDDYATYALAKTALDTHMALHASNGYRLEDVKEGHEIRILDVVPPLWNFWMNKGPYRVKVCVYNEHARDEDDRIGTG